MGFSIFEADGNLGNAPHETVVYYPFGENTIPGYVSPSYGGGSSIGSTGGYGPSPFVEQPLTALAPAITVVKTPSSLVIDPSNDGNTSTQTAGKIDEDEGGGFDAKTVLIGAAVIVAAILILKGGK